MGPFATDDFPKPAKREIWEAFHEARGRVLAMNDVMRTPMAFSLVACSYFAVALSAGLPGYGTFLRYILSVACVVMVLLLLRWLSSVGDAWEAARLRILCPTAAADLIDALGAERGQMFIQQLKETELGFEVITVHATSYRVLYLSISIVCACIYM